MAITKLSTDVIDLSNNTEALTIPSGGNLSTANVDYLLVGGGGGGGTGSNGNSGGGGGGGVISTTTYGGTAPKIEVSNGTTYTFSVGGGASGAWQSNATISYWISSAGSTTFNSLTALGGGNGGQGTGPQESSSPGEDGASGGGGGGCNFTAYPSLTPQMPGGSATQGNAGGDGVWYGLYYDPKGNGGGGGGFGTAGSIATSSGGGDGGDGILNSITGTNIYYAGGGGGGRGLSGALPVAQGGLGGGGDGGINNTSGGSVSVKPTNGERGKGAGGGGGMDNFTYTGYGGTGGSFGGNGVAIFRMPSNTTATFSSPKGLSPTQFSGNSFAEFNGTDSRMWVSGTDGTNRTYSFWAKPNTTTGNGGLISWFDNAGDYTQGGAIRDLNNNWVLSASNGSDYTIGSNSTSTWDHIVITSTSSNTKVYLNGTKTVDVAAGGVSCDNIYIGARNTTGGWVAFTQYYSGKMFNLRLYSAEFNQTSVNALNSETNSTLGSCSFPTGYVSGVSFPFHQGDWGPATLNGSYGASGTWAQSWNSIWAGKWSAGYWRDLTFHGLSSSLDTSTGDNVYTVDYAGSDTTVSFSVTGGTGRPTSPTEGLMRENTTTGKMEFYDGSLWQEINDTASSYSPGLIASANFNTALYTGNGGADSVAVGFQSELTWIKARDTTGKWNVWYDIIRGTTNMISSNSTGGAQAYGSVTPTVTGFDIGSASAGDLNTNEEDYVSWNWKAGGAATTITAGTVGNDVSSDVSANTDAGFSIVKYTGTLGAAGNLDVAHGLGAAPEIIISKRTDSTGPWRVRPFFLNSNPYNYLELNNTNAIANINPNNDGTMAMPTNNVFSNNWNSGLGGIGDVIAYCWRSIPGYSKIGFYVGNGSATGPIVYTGFKPAWLMIKDTGSSGGGWYIYDNKRDTSNPNSNYLRANQDTSETTGGNPVKDINFLDTGFQIANSANGWNFLGNTFIYMAFAE